MATRHASPEPLMQLKPGQAVKVFDGEWLYDAAVTGEAADFVSIKFTPLKPHLAGQRLVPRNKVFAMPGERNRLRQTLQSKMEALSNLLEELRYTDDAEGNGG